jgi:hypothetical protein
MEAGRRAHIPVAMRIARGTPDDAGAREATHAAASAGTSANAGVTAQATLASRNPA